MFSFTLPICDRTFQTVPIVMISREFDRIPYDVNSGKSMMAFRTGTSNRNRRGGCGKTVSVLLAQCIKHFTFTVRTIWLLFSNILSGMSKQRSMGDVHASPSTPYRLLKRLRDNIPNIRTRLSRIAAPPDSADVPETQTLKHLAAVFADSLNPIAAYQSVFQDSFFAIDSQKSGVLRT